MPRLDPLAVTRRHFFRACGVGVGKIALGSLLAKAAESVRAPHYAAKAKRVIHLFMAGAPSQLDLFDYKPALAKLEGKPLPPSVIGGQRYAFIRPDAAVLGPRFKFAKHGKCGAELSEMLPHLAKVVDEIALIKSTRTDQFNHAPAQIFLNTGFAQPGRPSLGSWVTYGLGSVNEDLPAFVVMQDNATQIVNGPRNWGSGFMPALYQGIRIQGGSEPIPNLNTPEALTPEQQRAKLNFLDQVNRRYAEAHADQTELEARIASYELAFRMQAQAPGAVDLAKESDATKKLYGIGEKETDTFGKQCLLARRLVERGVRFVQLYHGAGSKWDSHEKIEKNHSELCRQMDKPVAGLLKDLKSRGLLNDTLVVWGGEFGRTPMSEKGDGRDHNPTGFTMWMAGGGVKGGQTIGETDELGLHAVKDRLHVHDLHATILYLLGLDNMELVYKYKGRPERPTLNEGEAFRKIAA